MFRPILASAVLAIAVPAYADKTDGDYFGIQFGPTFSKEQDISPGFGLEADSSADVGFLAGAFYGQRHGKFRFELEYTLRSNIHDEVEVETPGLFGGVGEFDAEGTRRTQALMVNAHHDLFEIGGWSSSVGLGLGLAYLDVNDLTTSAGTLIDEDDWQLAGQAMVMVERALADNTHLGIGYRYFRTRRADFNTIAGPASFRFQNHEVFARLSWHFGEPRKAAPAPRPTPRPVAAPAPRPEPKVEPKPAPKPAPKPEPKPAPIPGPFLVYFDFDKADITASAAKIIADAADAYRRFDIVSVRAQGHTDSAGRSNYNDILAQRRAEAVRAALIAEGVPAEAISVASFGEHDLAVRTDDNVREDRNRRVEIILSR